VQLNDEAQAFRWLSLEAAVEMAINAPTRRLLEAVLVNGGQPGIPEGRN